VGRRGGTPDDNDFVQVGRDDTDCSDTVKVALGSDADCGDSLKVALGPDADRGDSEPLAMVSPRLIPVVSPRDSTARTTD
jgi:hypothetical protein